MNPLDGRGPDLSRSRTNPYEPTYNPADDVAAHRRQSLGGQARVPGVEPMTPESERLAEHPVELHRIHGSEPGERLAQLLPVSGLRQRRLDELIQQRRGGEKLRRQQLPRERPARDLDLVGQVGRPADDTVGHRRVRPRPLAQIGEVDGAGDPGGRFVVLHRRPLPEALAGREAGEQQLEVVPAEHAVESRNVEPAQWPLAQLVGFQPLDHVVGEGVHLLGSLCGRPLFAREWVAERR